MTTETKPTDLPPCVYCHPSECCGIHDVEDELRLLQRQQVERETAVLLNPCPPADLCDPVPGMTVLDIFAAHALAGHLAHPHASQRQTPDQIAAYSYRFARAMLDEKARQDAKAVPHG